MTNKADSDWYWGKDETRIQVVTFYRDDHPDENEDELAYEGEHIPPVGSEVNLQSVTLDDMGSGKNYATYLVEKVSYEFVFVQGTLHTRCAIVCLKRTTDSFFGDSP